MPIEEIEPVLPPESIARADALLEIIQTPEYRADFARYRLHTAPSRVDTIETVANEQVYFTMRAELQDPHNEHQVVSLIERCVGRSIDPLGRETELDPMRVKPLHRELLAEISHGLPLTLETEIARVDNSYSAWNTPTEAQARGILRALTEWPDAAEFERNKTRYRGELPNWYQPFLDAMKRTGRPARPPQTRFDEDAWPLTKHLFEE